MLHVSPDPEPVFHPSPVVVSELLDDVRRARTDLRRARAAGLTQETRAATSGLVTALTTYADMLSSWGLPVPYSIRDELRIFQAAMRASGPGSRS